MQTTYVYFIKVKELDLVNIGVTNNLEKRLKRLQAVWPCSIVLMGSIVRPTRNKAIGLEQRLRRQLEQYRTKGEWFKLEPSFLSDLIIKENQPKPENKQWEGLTGLSAEERIVQEAEWYKDGFTAFHAGQSLKSFPRLGKPYSGIWYRCKHAWQAGWNEAKINGIPQTERTTFSSRF